MIQGFSQKTFGLFQLNSVFNGTTVSFSCCNFTINFLFTMLDSPMFVVLPSNLGAN